MKLWLTSVTGRRESFGRVDIQAAAWVARASSELEAVGIALAEYRRQHPGYLVEWGPNATDISDEARSFTADNPTPSVPRQPDTQDDAPGACPINRNVKP